MKKGNEFLIKNEFFFMREKFKKKFYEFKKLLFHRNTTFLVLAEPLQLYINASSAAFA